MLQNKLNKKTIYILLFAGFFIVFLLGILKIPYIKNSLKTIGISINLLLPDGGWRPLEIFANKTTNEEYTIQSSSGRKLTIDIYKPQKLSEKKYPSMIIYTPFIGEGLEDKRLINLADSFAKIGFVVAVPWRDEDKKIISEKDINDITSAALFVKNSEKFKIEKIGLFGISYGSGPTLIASTNPLIKDSVSFIVSFSGYYDFQEVLNFITTGDYSYKDTKGHLEPHSYSKEILAETLRHHDIKELEKKLSPSLMMEKPKADIFISHSIDDRFIPYTQSLKMANILSEESTTLLTLTTIFEHGTYKKLNIENIWYHYIPNFLDFYKFFYNLISKHG